MNIGDCARNGIVEEVGDVDLHFPQVVAAGVPVAQQVLDVVHVLLVGEVTAQVRIADVGGAVPAGEHERREYRLPPTSGGNVPHLNAVSIAKELGALHFDSAAEWARTAQAIGEQVVAGKAGVQHGK